MRENKFRAWIKRKNELMYLKGFRYSGNEKIKITFTDEDCDDCTYTFLNKDVILEQFTGLLDKNGVEIYEGDIVCTPFIDPIFGDMMDKEIYYKQNWTVVFKDGSFVVDNGERLIYLYAFSQNGNVEVISNIHEKEI